MLRMDEVNKIRKSYFTYGRSINKIAKEFKRSWDTINRIVSMEQENLGSRGKRPNRGGTVVTTEIEQAVDGYFKEEEEKSVRRKQRYTAKKIYDELRAKGIYKGSRRTMETLVKKLREKYGQSKAASYLPLSFTLGSALQIDHGEADLIINKERFTGYLFVASVPGEVLRYCQIFPIKSQEACGEFHERAYSFFGGCFDRNIYDNDSVLIKKVLGTERHQTNFSIYLEEQYGFESHFCNLAAGNEKGAVENGVGYCRRNFLPGILTFSHWDEVNEYLEISCAKDISEGIHYKTNKPLRLAFEELKQILAETPAPPRKMWSKSIDCRVDSCQLIRVESHEYSVPKKFVGTYVEVALGVFQLKIFKDQELIATHERKYGERDSLQLDHYLDQLQYKAGAFWDCKATKGHKFDPAYLEISRRLSERLPKNEANREFVKILLLGRRYDQKDLLAGLDIALKFGALESSAIEYILSQKDIARPSFDEKSLRNKLKQEHLHTWTVDVSIYKSLCEVPV